MLHAAPIPLRTKFEDKNRARKNFSLLPLSPEEIIVQQAQIQAMEESSRGKAGGDGGAGREAA